MPANAIDWGMTVKPIVRPAKTSPTKSRLEYSEIHCSTYSFRLVRSIRDRRYASPASRLHGGFRLGPNCAHSASSTATDNGSSVTAGFIDYECWLTIYKRNAKHRARARYDTIIVTRDRRKPTGPNRGFGLMLNLFTQCFALELYLFWSAAYRTRFHILP